MELTEDKEEVIRNQTCDLGTAEEGLVTVNYKFFPLLYVSG